MRQTAIGLLIHEGICVQKRTYGQRYLLETSPYKVNIKARDFGNHNGREAGVRKNLAAKLSRL